VVREEAMVREMDSEVVVAEAAIVMTKEVAVLRETRMPQFLLAIFHILLNKEIFNKCSNLWVFKQSALDCCMMIKEDLKVQLSSILEQLMKQEKLALMMDKELEMLKGL
jgi:hypothetical protein